MVKKSVKNSSIFLRNAQQFQQQDGANGRGLLDISIVFQDIQAYNQHWKNVIKTRYLCLGPVKLYRRKMVSKNIVLV